MTSNRPISRITLGAGSDTELIGDLVTEPGSAELIVTVVGQVNDIANVREIIQGGDNLDVIPDFTAL